jgi:hypothetical protein
MLSFARSNTNVLLATATADRDTGRHNAHKSRVITLEMHVPHIRAITNAEFVQMMGKCRPPTGWPTTIGPLTLTFSAADTLNTPPI